jgi:inhibitor of KinA sporulation pathway (predicted exonuclease)
MPGMLEYLQLPFIGRHHSGIDDTRNIANIMLKIIDDGHRLNNFTVYSVYSPLPIITGNISHLLWNPNYPRFI